MSKIKTKIYKLDDEYKLTVYSDDESFDLYFDTEEDADEIADLAQSYDSFEEAKLVLDSDDEDSSEINESAATPELIRKIVKALNDSGEVVTRIDYNGTIKQGYGSDVTFGKLSSSAIDAGAFIIRVFFKDERHREDIVNKIVGPLGYHEVYIDYIGIGDVMVPKSITKSKLIELIEQGARKDFIQSHIDSDSEGNYIFSNDQILVVADVRYTISGYYKLDIFDISPTSLKGFDPYPEFRKVLKIQGDLKDSNLLKDVVKGSNSIKTAYKKVVKYLDSNNIHYYKVK